METLFGYHNPVLISWPKPIITFNTKNSHPCLSPHHRQNSMTYLFSKMPLKQDVIFIFKLVCNTNHDYETEPDPEIIWSVWETYKFAGDLINQNFTAQEIFYTDANTKMLIKPIQSKLQRRKDFQQTVIRAVAPVWTKSLDKIYGKYK